MEAKFVHGDPVMADYTAGADIVAGQVVVVNNAIRIAHTDIANGAFGALAVGGGVYEMLTGGVAFADGKKVFWDDTNNVITEQSTVGKFTGLTVLASGTADTFTKVFHVASAS